MLRTNPNNTRIGMLVAAWRMLELDRRCRRCRVTREQSLDGTLEWLRRAHDATPDGGVANGYSLVLGWTISYPETTGYIMQTLVEHARLFDAPDLLERVRAMAHWEADIQWPEGGTPSDWGEPDERPVVFNTGPVLLGWASYLRVVDDPRIRDAAAKAARWVISCMSPEGFFERGLSRSSRHGRLSHNAMVSWGLVELAKVLGDDDFLRAATRSAAYYAFETVTPSGWPSMTGIGASQAARPWTHALGYTIQGLMETGRLTERPDIVEVALRALDRSLALMDVERGFLPGQIDEDWSRGSSWCCLTGSSQFACSMLRAVRSHGATRFLRPAERLVDYVTATQIPHDANGVPAFGVRGSYPFSFGGYARSTFINWAAKFHLDSLHHLHALDKVRSEQDAAGERSVPAESATRA